MINFFNHIVDFIKIIVNLIEFLFKGVIYAVTFIPRAVAFCVNVVGILPAALTAIFVSAFSIMAFKGVRRWLI